MNTETTPKWRQISSKLKRFFQSSEDRNKQMLLRKRKVLRLFTQRLTVLKVTLLAVGYLWMLVLPFPDLGRSTYMDENALQPAQVNTKWDWGHVHEADIYLEKLEQIRDSNFTSEQRGRWFQNEFASIGISSSAQEYSFSTSLGDFNGTNAYAILASPRHSGTEAMVISASWISRSGDDSLNLRGVATVLALAGFLKHYSYWSKDIIFVISDGYIEGMQAWLSSYHSSIQTGLRAQPLELTSGVIWTALNIDYPGHSFSHIGLFSEALNGRLPNQDLINSVERISRYTAGVPVTLYDHLDPREEPAADVAPLWPPKALYQIPGAKTYFYQARNVARHVRYQYHGRGSGVHGLFRKFRIDAITLFCIPATGPHGFHAIGRTVESALRTMNNLIERLHASFFFYVLTSPSQFLKIGLYLPSAILISIAVMIHGLTVWVDAAWVRDTTQQDKSETAKWKRRKRPVTDALCIVIATHTLGAVLFPVISSSWYIKHYEVLSPVIFALFAALPLSSIALPPTSNDTAPTSAVLKAANLCLASTVISIVTVLNFSLAATLTVLLAVPLILASSSSHLAKRLVKYLFYVTLGLGWLFAHKEVLDSIWSWQVLSVWFAPFICVVYVPLFLQAGIVCLLSP